MESTSLPPQGSYVYFYCILLLNVQLQTLAITVHKCGSLVKFVLFSFHIEQYPEIVLSPSQRMTFGASI